MPEGNAPIYSNKKGQIQIAQFESQEGYKGPPIVLQKSYRGKDGKWVNRKIGLYPNELAPILEILQEFERDAPKHKDA